MLLRFYTEQDLKKGTSLFVDACQMQCLQVEYCNPAKPYYSAELVLMHRKYLIALNLEGGERLLRALGNASGEDTCADNSFHCLSITKQPEVVWSK